LIGGPHNDALMIGLIVAGLAVASSFRAGTSRSAVGLSLFAGLLLGLAVAVKVTAVVVVPFAMLLVCARPYRWRPALRGGGGLAAGVVAAMGGVTVASGLGLGWIAGLVNTRDLVRPVREVSGSAADDRVGDRHPGAPAAGLPG
jgi:alpha-1,6-mannosyltransferase